MKAPYDVAILGAGLDCTRHLTREAHEYLEAARIVFHSSYNAQVPSLVRGINPSSSVVDLDPRHYLVGSYRPEIYRAIADTVVAAGREAPGVVLLEPGSPVVTDRITRLVLRECSALGLTAIVVPGISSLEAAMTLLALDPSRGLQIIQAQQLVLQRRRLDPTVHVLVLQPGCYDTLWWAGQPEPRAGRFTELQEALLSAYPPEAELALLLLSIRSGAPDHQVWFRLRDFPDLVGFLSPLHTLFIPACKECPTNPTFQRRIESWEALVGNSVPAVDEAGGLGQISCAGLDLIPDHILRRSLELQKAWRVKSLSGTPVRGS